ncbi:MAG TPA: nuclear transport factor 2 family protein [Vicinamibacterales bacterium]|nr:nuclear transport factor 2 family protein [Vicinamibacterales bacterium]
MPTHSNSKVGRRSFVGVAGLAGVAAFGSLAPLAGAELSAAEKANVDLITAFCASWSTRDMTRIAPFLAGDSVYRMSETTPPVIGPDGVRERLESWLETSQQIEFRILDTFAKGPIVVTHRIDRFVSTSRPLTWEGVGVFFVKDAKIKEWSDYTIRVERPPDAK